MLARLLQGITFGLIVAALAWAIHFLRQGRPGWAAAGAIAILSGHAVALAIECVLMTLANRRDALGAAPAGEVLRAWWGEVLGAPRVFCWRQPFREQQHPDRLDMAPSGTDDAGRRGLLLVHGFLCNRGVWNAWYPRLARDGVPYVGISLEPVFDSIERYVDQVEAGVRQLEAATGRPPVIVAHSMGGLAVRAWLRQVPGAARRVSHVVTLATPHHGTLLARWAVSPNTRQMRHGSRWLQALADAEGPSVRRRFTCVYSRCDNIVFPVGSACLPGAARREIAGCAHVHMVDHPQAWNEVARRVGATLLAD